MNGRMACAVLSAVAVLLTACSPESPLPRLFAHEAPSVRLPPGITAAAEWQPGLGEYEGNITFAQRHPSLEALGDAIWTATHTLVLPTESCGYDGPTYPVQDGDRTAFYIVSLVFSHGDSGGSETLLALAHDEGGWYVTDSWSRTLSRQGVPPTICDNWNPQVPADLTPGPP